MPEYFDLFTESENERYKGYNEFLQCVNKSLVASDLKNVRETIKLVQDAVNDEINKKEDDTASPSTIEYILDSKGNLLPEVIPTIYKRIETSVKSTHKVLNKSILIKILLKVALELLLQRKPSTTECIEDVFDVDFFMIVGHTFPPMTPEILSNLKKLHSSILQPIAKYYKGNGMLPDDGICRFKITNGLMSKSLIVSHLLGTIESPHATGKAMDFYIQGIDVDTIFKDLTENKFKINWGLAFNRGGLIHISLPYGKFFKNFILTKELTEDSFITSMILDGKSILST